jgi:hypothetical protein
MPPDAQDVVLVTMMGSLFIGLGLDRGLGDHIDEMRREWLRLQGGRPLPISGARGRELLPGQIWLAVCGALVIVLELFAYFG